MSFFNFRKIYLTVLFKPVIQRGCATFGSTKNKKIRLMALIEFSVHIYFSYSPPKILSLLLYVSSSVRCFLFIPMRVVVTTSMVNEIITANTNSNQLVNKIILLA